MPLPDNMVQQMLIDECLVSGSSELRDTALLLMPFWWSMYEGKRQELRYWYVRRSLLMYLAGRARIYIDTQLGPDKVSASQVFAQTNLLLGQAQAECKRLDPTVGVPTLKMLTGKGTLPDRLQEDLARLERGLYSIYNPFASEISGVFGSFLLDADGN